MVAMGVQNHPEFVVFSFLVMVVLAILYYSTPAKERKRVAEAARKRPVYLRWWFIRIILCFFTVWGNG